MGVLFCKVNILVLWILVFEKVCVLLGMVLLWMLIGVDEVLILFNGNMVVKFKICFVNRVDVVEMIVLMWEDGGWKVVGCYIE